MRFDFATLFALHILLICCYCGKRPGRNDKKEPPLRMQRRLEGQPKGRIILH
jgi:hypothetical protein